MHRHLIDTYSLQFKAKQLKFQVIWLFLVSRLTRKERVREASEHLRVLIGFLDLFFCGKADTEREPTQLLSLLEHLPAMGGESLK